MPSEWDKFKTIGTTQQGANETDYGGSFGGINPNLKGEEYLKQFTPEEQSQVRDFLAGRRMPTGNPRKQDFIRQAASKFGEDIGLPADDTAFKARQTMQTELARGSPASIGGQLRNGTTAMDHLAKVAEAAANLHNYDPIGVAPIGHGLNYLKSFTSRNSAAALGLQDAAHNYGSEITKFYAGSPGGVSERERFLKSLNPNLTPSELAAVLEQELNLIPGKMDQFKEEIGSTLGPFVAGAHKQKFDEQDKHKARILRAIETLRGTPGSFSAGPSSPVSNPSGAAPAAAPAAPAAIPSSGGMFAVNPKTGERLTLSPDGSAWVPAQ